MAYTGSPITVNGQSWDYDSAYANNGRYRVTGTPTAAGQFFTDFVAACAAAEADGTLGAAGALAAHAVDHGSRQFEFDACVQIGDGSTATTCSDTNAQVVFKDGVIGAHEERWIEKTNGATFQLGNKGTYIYETYDSVSILNLESTYRVSIIYAAGSSGPLYLYSTKFNAADRRQRLYIAGSTSDEIANVWGEGTEFRTANDNATYYNITIGKGGAGPLRNCKGTFQYITLATDGTNQIYMVDDLEISNLRGPGNSSSFIFMAPSFDDPEEAVFIDDEITNFGINWNADATAHIYRKRTFKITVIDSDNTAINGATVTCYNVTDSSQEFSETTDASGQYGHSATVTVPWMDYWYSGGDQSAEKTLRFTIGKAGYKTTEFEAKAERPIDWTVQLKPAVIKEARRHV